MISWLQRVLQKHYKWLFSIMLGIIIIAFVFTIGGSPGIGRGKYSTEKQMYYGINLNDPEEVRELFQYTNLSNILNTGKNITSNQVAENMALSRPVLLELAKNLEVIKPNEYELAEYIKTKPVFKDENGKFDVKKYQDFLKAIKSDPRMNEKVVRLILSQDMEIESVLKLLGGSGYVLPFEAELSVERQKTLWSVDVASLDFQDFNSDIAVPEDKLAEFYVANKHNFAIPSKTEISYVSIPMERFLKKIAAPSEEELKDFYDANLSLFTQVKDDVKPFEEVKGKVTELYKKDRAVRLAAEAANDFAYDIYQNRITFNSKGFEETLKKYNLSLQKGPTFDEDTIPKDSPLPEALLKQALTLNEHNYFSDVATTDKGAYIAFFKEEHPVSIPPLEEIKNELKKQYLAKENLKLLESKSKILDKKFNTALKNGKSFKEVAKNEGLKVSSFDKFNILEAPKDLNKTLLQDIHKLNKGELSPAIMRDDRVYFVYVSEKEVPVLSEDNPDVQSLLKQLDLFTSTMRSQAIVGELIAKGLEASAKKK